MRTYRAPVLRPELAVHERILEGDVLLLVRALPVAEALERHVPVVHRAPAEPQVHRRPRRTVVYLGVFPGARDRLRRHLVLDVVREVVVAVDRAVFAPNLVAVVLVHLEQDDLLRVLLVADAVRGRTRRNRLHFVRVALRYVVLVGGVHVQNVRRHQFHAEAPKAADLVRIDFQNYIVFDLSIAFTPNGDRIFGYVDEIVQHLVRLAHRALRDERSL